MYYDCTSSLCMFPFVLYSGRADPFQRAIHLSGAVLFSLAEGLNPSLCNFIKLWDKL